MDGNLVFPVPPGDIIKIKHSQYWNYCGWRSIALEWPDDGGQC